MLHCWQDIINCFPKFKEVTSSHDTSLLGVIYNACTSTPMYQLAHKNLKCLASPFPKIWLGQNHKKQVTWPWSHSLGCSLSSEAKHLIYSTCIQNLATVTSVIPEIWLKLKNGSRDTDHGPLGVVCHQSIMTVCIYRNSENHGNRHTQSVQNICLLYFYI